MNMEVIQSKLPMLRGAEMPEYVIESIGHAIHYAYYSDGKGGTKSGPVSHVTES
ncbi:MAG: hypothetical protein WB444_12910 [Gallionella sp.]